MLDLRGRVAELAQKRGAKLAARWGHDARVVRWTRPFYSAALGWMASGRGVEWAINGVNYRIDIRHRDRMAHEYESGVARFLRQVVQPGFVCFDVGANVGAYVLQLCHWSAPGGRVVAFEPNPEARQILERHTAMNGFNGRVQIVPIALGAAEDSAILYAAGADGMSRLGAPNPSLVKHSRALKVPVTTLDHFVRTSNIVPDLVLIDVEGLEAAVLEGARDTIRACRGKLHLVVELHPTLWPLTNTTSDRVAALFDELRLRPRSLTGQKECLSEYGLVYLEPIEKGEH